MYSTTVPPLWIHSTINWSFFHYTWLYAPNQRENSRTPSFFLIFSVFHCRFTIISMDKSVDSAKIFDVFSIFIAFSVFHVDFRKACRYDTDRRKNDREREKRRPLAGSWKQAVWVRMVQNQTKTAGIAVSQVLEQKIDIDDASFSELRFETQPAGGDVPP